MEKFFDRIFPGFTWSSCWMKYNKIHELKNEICCFKNQLEDGEKKSDSISVVNVYKSDIYLSKDQNFFSKSELLQKQIIVENF